MKGFIPYGRQFIDKNDVYAVGKVLRSDFITTGPKAMEFEKAICGRLGCRFAVAVSSGTAALHIASLAVLKKNDKVLVSPNTFLSTVNSIIYAGGIPVFVDIDDEGNVDLDRCIELLEGDSSIKALFGVHFSGNMLNQEKLEYIRKNFNIIILEDCAHSLGAYYDGIKSGSCTNSDVSILSFHPVKHITTGEGGMATTNSKKTYKRLIALRNSGVVKKNFENSEMAYDRNGNLNPWYYEMQSIGFNYRITDFQCALGLSQLSKLDDFLYNRVRIAKRYDEAFYNHPIIKPLYFYKSSSSYHLYVIKIDFSHLKITKAELFNLARERGIGLQVHYIPVYRQPYYQKSGYKGVFLQKTEDYYEKAVSIPIYPLLDDEEQNYVIDVLLDITEANRL